MEIDPNFSQSTAYGQRMTHNLLATPFGRCFLPPIFQEYMFLNTKFIPEFKNAWNLESSFLALLHLIHAMASLLIGTKVKDAGLLGIVLILNYLF